MNTLQLVVAADPESAGRNRSVDIVIDGQRLIDILKRIEAPYTAAEGSPEIAGQYSSLSIATTFLPSRHFLNTSRSASDHVEKRALLFCDCGFAGCWDFVCRMTFSENTVTWSDFEQIHRKKWDYSELGKLVFGRKAYEAQLSQNP